MAAAAFTLATTATLGAPNISLPPSSVLTKTLAAVSTKATPTTLPIMISNPVVLKANNHWGDASHMYSFFGKADALSSSAKGADAGHVLIFGNKADPSSSSTGGDAGHVLIFGNKADPSSSSTGGDAGGYMLFGNKADPSSSSTGADAGYIRVFGNKADPSSTEGADAGYIRVFGNKADSA